jgi:c-di-GMP-binding flagellar brake protein YcgR
MFDALFGKTSTNSGKVRSGRSTYKITSPKQIATLLNQAHQAHCLLYTRFKDNPERFNTALLGIYPKQGFLVLDELTPKEGHELLLTEKQVQVIGKVDGVDLRFDTRLLEAREKSGIAFYKMALPDSVIYRQLRQEHRVSTGALRMTFRGYRGQGYQQALRGFVCDLSRGGIGVILEEMPTLYPGDIMPACTVVLPQQEEILFSLEVRHSRPNSQREITRIGGRFEEIDADSRRKIVRLINKLEREKCKRQRRGS